MAKPGTPDTHIEAAKRRLVHLRGVSLQVAESERRILEAAEHRAEAVAADLGQLRNRVNTDPAAAARYQESTLEAGQLARVIASARQHLCQ